MLAKPQHPAASSRPTLGFTLVELLLALGIFAIGMVAVASLFPVAAILQRETANEVFAESAAASATAIVDGKTLNLSSTDLTTFYTAAGTGDNRVVPLHAIRANLLTQWYTPQARSYPTSQVTSTGNITNCDLHWVPFLQDLAADPTNPNWVMRIFILEADTRATYTVSSGNANPNDIVEFPKVFATTCTVVDDDTFTLGTSTHGLSPGDLVMDSNGADYLISEVNGAQINIVGKILTSPENPVNIWYAPPMGGTSSPAVRIETVTITPNTP